jgi:beta-phosphoglucomutase-like phosphatase (HAD superfamily)
VSAIGAASARNGATASTARRTRASPSRQAGRGLGGGSADGDAVRLGGVARLTAGGRIVGLASSSRRAFVDRVLDALGLSRVFAAIATGDEVARGKPDPEIYELVARRLAVPAPQCVAVEDTPAGVAAAAAAGMTTIAVPNVLTARPDLSHADAVASGLREAVALVLRLDGASGGV